MRKPVKCIKHNTCSKPRRRSRRYNHGEDIGDFGLADIKAGLTKVGQAVTSTAKTLAAPYAASLVRDLQKEKLKRAAAAADARRKAERATRQRTTQQQEQQQQQQVQQLQAKQRSEQLTSEKAKYQQDLIERQAWDAKNAEQKAALMAAGRSRNRNWVEPPVPREPETKLKEDWGAAKQYVKQGAKYLATPQGMYQTTKGAVVGGANAALKAGKWLEQKRQDEINYQEDQRKEKLRHWNEDLTSAERKEILEDQYLRKQMGQKLKQMRQQAFDYQMDKTDAYLSGRKFTPRVFKVSTPGEFGIGETEKYLDEYGRELPGMPEEVTRKSSGRSRRSETQDINSIFGLTSGGPIRSPLDEPRQKRQMLPAGEEDYEMPRQRRPRYAQEPSQYSQPQSRIVGNSAKREADDIRRLLM
jgi:hypothetical protein